MASYCIAAALAAVATLSSAGPTQDRVKDLSKGQPSHTSPLIRNPCPNPHWEYIKEYHTYPYNYDVQLYWNCGHQTALEKCPKGTVFNQELHYCDWDKETSKNFVCPPFRHAWRGYRLFPDPNFKYQYHKCYNDDIFPAKRRACPYDHIFDPHSSTCEYAHYLTDKE